MVFVISRGVSRPLVQCGTTQTVGVDEDPGIAFSTQLWMPYAILLGFAGAATSQLFADEHDELSAHPNPGNDGVVAVVRMAMTGGWVIGLVSRRCCRDPVCWSLPGGGSWASLIQTALCASAGHVFAYGGDRFGGEAFEYILLVAGQDEGADAVLEGHLG